MKYTSHVTTLTPSAEVITSGTNLNCMSSDFIVMTCPSAALNCEHGVEVFEACSIGHNYASGGKEHCVFGCQCQSELLCEVYLFALLPNIEICKITVTS